MGPIEFVYGTFGPLGGLLVAKKRLIGVGFEGERMAFKGALSKGQKSVESKSG